MKKILAAVMSLVLLMPFLAQAISVTNPSVFTPNDSLLTADFRLAGKLKTLLQPLIEEAVEESSAEKLQTLADIFLAGEQFSFSLSATLGNGLVSFPVTENQWATFTEDTEKTAYGGGDIYTDIDDGTAMAKLGGFMLLGTTESIQQAIDLAEGKTTDSLGTNAGYQSMVSSYLSPRLLSFTLNMKSIVNAVDSFSSARVGQDAEQGAEAMVNGVKEIISLFDFEGFSASEVNDGYKFNFKVVGNAAKLRENGISFNPGTNFTPSLYTKFPAAKPILYSESFNPKASNEQSNKILDMLKESFGGEVDIMAQIEDQTGLDINGIYDVFTKGFAVALQHDGNSPLPYFTLLGDVSGTKEAASALAESLVREIKDFLKENDAPKAAYRITTAGAFTKIKLDLPKFDEEYDGPPFKPVTLTVGVGDDGLFIISTYPGIEDANVRTGIASNSDLVSYIHETGNNTGIFYLSAREAFSFFDALTAWGEQAGDGEHGPPLDFYQGYYSILEQVYGWKDIFVASHATETEANVAGEIHIDSAKHKTYEQLLKELKESDRDEDGVSDYDERYLYNTPSDNDDSDEDGVQDFEELKKGTNPDGEGRLFNDVSEDAYYTDEVGLLYQRGAIRGYDDGSFQPGKLVNRAEFATMVVKSFEEGSSNFLGVDLELKSSAPPFVDVDENAWYYSPVAKAYSAGFVSGSRDEHGDLVFRPGAPITRAEAIAILNKASSALNKTSPSSCTGGTFSDVKSTDWFCGAVVNGYENGITKGRTPGKFDPQGLLNRAEAAVMIRRTLEKDLAHAASGTESVGEFAAPVSGALLPAASGFVPFRRQSTPTPESGPEHIPGPGF